MFARLITIHGAPERLEEDIRQFQQHIDATVYRQPGFRGAYVLMDRQNNTALCIALWHTQQDLQASEAQEAKLYARVVNTGAAARLPVQAVYEVAVAPPTLTGITPAAPALSGR
jgi:hypothetical protein